MGAGGSDAPDFAATTPDDDPDDGDDDEDDEPEDEVRELEWPLALRILPPALETGPLREHVTRLAAEVERQAAAAEVEPRLLKALSADVSRLRQLLAERADFLPVSQTAKDDARRFLRQLSQSPTGLR
jgi:hypothetical protein